MNRAAMNRAVVTRTGSHRIDPRLVRRHIRSRGVSIVTAIFLLVVLSGVGAAIVTTATTQRQSATIDLLGTRAYEAARTGVEFGLFQFLGNNGACVNTSFTAPGALSAMTVTVTCVTVGTDGAPALTQTRITATACNAPAGGACPNAAPGADYVQRVVQVVI
ncbi:agglutinin biogenesis protein MshP [Pseudoduganella albidiflava]|uniref:Agglutinin biogenesis protein MshP n=2 Tax=Pseudoduganella albidiflava TaxID=321983 RepID=A0ABX5RVB3_9BURK|nr:agglutinin biogenesis protein MshP [Pseudoduganella albidiflava]QBI01911.1 agglutinin biogenesis protein MshP [Pseudoduganella albidiflava]